MYSCFTFKPLTKMTHLNIFFVVARSKKYMNKIFTLVKYIKTRHHAYYEGILLQKELERSKVRTEMLNLQLLKHQIWTARNKFDHSYYFIIDVATVKSIKLALYQNICTI